VLYWHRSCVRHPPTTPRNRFSTVNHSRASRFNGLEFTLVIGIAFGQFIVFSIASLLAGPGTDDHMFDTGHLAYLLVYESIASAIVALILWRNGWRLRDFHLQPSLAATGQGVGLACAGWLVYYLAAIIARSAFGSIIGDRISEDQHLTLGGAAPLLILLVSLLNPLFEEILACSYVIEALRSRLGVVAAINVSTALRVSYHVYQGPFAFLWVAMLGLLFAYAYVKWRRLWPVIVAHGLHDYVALSLV
jgi:membrane protease YdiL (CAAX protease family)